jgi:4-hydroxybenzoate polyprenyltransferase
MLRDLRITLEMIKWEHSVFALPFALTAAMLAASGLPPASKLAWIILAMVAARSAAMAFNRLVDADIDAANPRTKMRAIPAGLLSRRYVGLFVTASCVLLVVAAWRLNRIAFYLSPVALAIVLLYSYTKRFTRWSHLVLGFALGIAPAAAWIAVRGSFDARILILTAAVTLWVGGFDILYACQDVEFDRAQPLYSVPKSFGIRNALLLARVLHVMMVLLLLWLIAVFGLGIWSATGVAIVALLLAWEHSLVSAHDLSRLNAAFFTVNGVVSIVFFVFVACDLLLRR